MPSRLASPDTKGGQRVTPDKAALIHDIEDLGFTVITTQQSSSRWECAVMLETIPAQTIATATGSTELEAIQAAHLEFVPDDMEAHAREVRALLAAWEADPQGTRALLEGMGT